ncbi:polymer-forming cytoskeletal protein [Treponema sp. UBA7567]|uniref:polymer-forming cytoskeletal protein n=1 Tax=Treponema sp. UBA7567 TaxID=1947748 RepID=UPI0025E12601|nr:polymer-forming cytoskeletal protein [Treponema sp. UBA7567]
MKKFSFIKIFRFALVFLPLIFGSCSFFSDSWNEPVKDYFQKYTETSAVTDYEVVSGVYEKGSGKIFVSSSQDFEVRLFLRNPQKYVFPADCLKLSFPNFDKDSAENKFGEQIDTGVVSILQDESDASVMILKYPAEFLALSETGFDISPEIRLFHPVSKADFGSYTSLRAICNSAPPLVFGAVVYKDSSSGKYVVFFNMPSKGLLSKIHSDIKSLSVNGEKTSVVLNADGTFEFENESFKVGNNSSSYSPASSVLFVEYGQAAYFVTDDVLTDEDTTYAIGLFDEAGFSSKVSTSVSSIRLDGVMVKDSSENELQTGDAVSQDENSSYATITLSPAQNASDGSDTSDSIVVYELYQGLDDTGKVLYSGKNSGGEISLKIPAGKVFLRVYSHKDLYADSIPKEFGIQVLKSVLYVSPNGSDTENTGSSDSPFATIAKTFSDDGFSDITVLGTVQLAGSVDEDVELSVANANVVISGNGNSVSSLKMAASGGKLKTDKLNVAGNVVVENGEFSVLGGTISGDITVSGGTLLLKDCAVGGKINYNGGKLILEGGTVVSDSIVFGDDSLVVYVKNLTAQKVAAISGVDSRSKGSEILVSTDGDEKSMSETCKLFDLDSEKWVLTADSSGKKGVLNSSGGNIIVQEYTLSFAAADSVKPGEKIGVSVIVTDSDGQTVQTSDLDFTNWSLKFFNHGTFTGVSSSENSIETGENWPLDSYQLFVSVEFNGSAYSSVLDVELTK